MPKLKEKANPAVEFKNDALMREIHENRLKIYEQTKNMEIEEKVKLIKKKAKEFRINK